MKKIPKQKSIDIKALLAKGISVREIARTGISKSTVGRLRSKIIIETSRTKTGRPKKLSAADDRIISRIMHSGKADNAVQATQTLNKQAGKAVSPSTVRRSLKRQGMKSVVKKKKPMLSALHG